MIPSELPDMAQLIIIQFSELKRGKEIGSGAFGTVFQVWNLVFTIYFFHFERYKRLILWLPF